MLYGCAMLRIIGAMPALSTQNINIRDHDPSGVHVFSSLQEDVEQILEDMEEVTHTVHPSPGWL